MFGGLYFGQTYFGGFGAITGVKRLLRPVMRLINGVRSMKRVRA